LAGTRWERREREDRSARASARLSFILTGPRLGRALLLLLGLCIAFGLNELLVRIALPAPQLVHVHRSPAFEKRVAWERSRRAVLELADHPEGGGLYVETRAGRRLRANALAVIENHRLSGRRIEIETNSIGYRNEEIGPKRGVRLLFLGDSITFGDYLPEEETFVRRVEGLARGRGSDWETINAGVGSIGLENEIAILHETGLDLDPDVVVVGFYLNDFHDSPGVHVRRLPAPFDRSRLLQYVSTTWTTQRALRGKARVRALEAEQARWLSDFDRTWPGVPGDYRRDQRAFNGEIRRNFRDWGGAWSTHAWERMRPSFAELKRLSEERGFALFIVAFPVDLQVSAPYVYDHPQRQLAEVADDLEIGMLDLLPVMREAHARSSQPLFYDQCHHTPAGNELIALSVTDFLTERMGGAGVQMVSVEERPQ
jgi:hypothetical protein